MLVGADVVHADAGRVESAAVLCAAAVAAVSIVDLVLTMNMGADRGARGLRGHNGAAVKTGGVHAVRQVLRARGAHLVVGLEVAGIRVAVDRRGRFQVRASVDTVLDLGGCARDSELREAGVVRDDSLVRRADRGSTGKGKEGASGGDEKAHWMDNQAEGPSGGVAKCDAFAFVNAKREKAAFVMHNR